MTLLILSTIVATLSGCAAHGRQWENKTIVQHYESMRNELRKKEQAGTEGGCPTCVN